MCALRVRVPRGAQEVFDAIDVIGLDPLFHQHQINRGVGGVNPAPPPLRAAVQSDGDSRRTLRAPVFASGPPLAIYRAVCPC